MQTDQSKSKEKKKILNFAILKFEISDHICYLLINVGFITMGLVTLPIFSEVVFSWLEDRILSPACNFKCLS